MKRKSYFELLILILAVILIWDFYPCLESRAKNCPAFFLGESYNIYAIIFVISLLIYIICVFILAKDKWKLPYYFSEFLMIIFGIYSIVLIKNALEISAFFEMHRIVALLSIFVIFLSLFKFKEYAKKKSKQTLIH